MRIFQLFLQLIQGLSVLQMRACIGHQTEHPVGFHPCTIARQLPGNILKAQAQILHHTRQQTPVNELYNASFMLTYYSFMSALCVNSAHSMTPDLSYYMYITLLTIICIIKDFRHIYA